MFVGRYTIQFCIAISSLWSVTGNAESALIAVATNFAEVAEVLTGDFENLGEHEISISTGSTGKLYAQIVNGAPYDALLAADQEYARRLGESGAAVPGSVFTYAIGRLSLWSRDEKMIGEDGIALLERHHFRSLAIANPDLAPYGAAAREVLQRAGLWESLQPNLVTGENAGQAFALVATGNAELGFVALASVLSRYNPRAGSRWDVPEELHAPIRQEAVLLKHGAENAAAVAFLAYLKSDEARLTIASFGYGFD